MTRFVRLAAALITIGIAIVLGILATSGPDEPQASMDGPHVIVISIDTLRRDHLVPYGYAGATDPAPSVSALAREGVVFERAFAANSNTAPSHASILTGLYPPSHGVLRNGYRLDKEVATLGELLAARGYRTAGFVSGFTLKDGPTGLGRGFDHYDDGDPRQRDRPAAKTFARVQQWLAAYDFAAPLFLFVHFFDPHFPYRAPPAHAEKFIPAGKDRYAFPVAADLARIRTTGPQPGEAQEYAARYAAEIHYADAQVGALLAQLRRRGVYDECLILFVSDHGETLGERKFAFDHGGRLYDEQVRVPLVIRFPAAADAGLRVPATVHHVDILATIARQIGFVPPPHQGRDLQPSIIASRQGAATADRRPIFSMARPVPGRVPGLAEPIIRQGQVTSVRLDELKLIAYPTAGGYTYELFDLRKDPDERNSLAATQPQIVARLAGELQSWRTATGGDRITPPPALSADTEEALRALGYIE